MRVGPDGVVTVISPKIEMGQGAQTGIAMMVAEELEVPLDQVVIQEAPPNSALYTDSLMQFQATGGSTSTRVTWEPLRRAGATARILLIQAAALQWRVAPSLCHAQNGQVFGPNGLQAGYGDLVEAAATLPLPDAVPLKTPEQFKLLGTPAQRLDTPAKVNGKARFTIDLQIPGMLVASSITCPVYGGLLLNVDDTAARRGPGVRDIVRLDNAVAVTASNFWACQQAIRALKTSGTSAHMPRLVQRSWTRSCSRPVAVMAWSLSALATLNKPSSNRPASTRRFTSRRCCPIHRLSP